MEDKTPKQNLTQQQPQKPEASHISKTDFGLMLSTAIFFDLTLAVIQLIPFAGSAAAMTFNTVPLMLFFIWYKLKGIDFSNPKRGFSFFGTAVIEFIPVINALPTWTAEIVYMYTLENKDKILSIVSGATKVAGVAGFGAKVASSLPATALVGRALGEVSHQASRVAQQAEMVSELHKNNSVGNEIRSQKSTDQKEETPSNVIQFPGAQKQTPFNKDNSSTFKKAA
jgi:hypothetical protein